MSRVLFPFSPNWRNSYSVTHSFKTDIFTNDSGGETRRADRQTPRRQFSFGILVAGEDRRRWERLVSTAQNMQVVMPDFSRFVPVLSIDPPNRFVYLNGTVPPWLTVGSEIVSLSAPGREVLTVQAILGTRITTEETPTPWPKNTRVYQAATGRLPPEIAAPLRTNGTAEPAITFDVDPGSEKVSASGVYSQFEGRPIFDRPVNWSRGVEVSHQWPVETVDYGWGKIGFHQHVDFPTDRKLYDFLNVNTQDAEALVRLFCDMRGRRGEFIRSTLCDDVTWIDAPQVGATYALAAGLDLFNFHQADPVHCALAVTTNAGTTYLRIAGLTEESGNTRVQFTAPVQPPLGTQHRRTSWAKNSRFAGDDLTIEWITEAVSQCRIGITSLPMVDPFDYLGLRVTPLDDERATTADDDRAVILI